jgi:hypothetical protein
MTMKQCQSVVQIDSIVVAAIAASDISLIAKTTLIIVNTEKIVNIALFFNK